MDIKTKTCDAKYPIAEGKVASAVKRRATEASRAYLTRARKLDADLGTPAGTKGLFERELEAYGKGGRVIIPVVGAFGEMSSDVNSIVDLVASVLTHEHLSHDTEDPAAVKRHVSAAHLLVSRSLGSPQLGSPPDRPLKGAHQVHALPIELLHRWS